MPRKSRKNVGIIGLGIIGSRVATALRNGGFHVYVWNRTPRAAPNFLGSPAEVAELCDVLQIFVSDAHALFDVLDSMGENIGENHLVIVSGTVGPEATLEAAKLVEERGGSFLDAPFTGSKLAAEQRQLVYYVGGEPDVIKRAEPLLKATSKAIVRVGKVGQAATIKVATNMLAAVTVQTLAEALAIVQRSGISEEVMADVLEHHGVRSPVLDIKLGKILHSDYEPHFALKHMFKDVQLAIHIANALDIDVPATTATAGVMYGGLNRGWSDLDFSAIAKVYEREDESKPEPEKPKDEPAPAGEQKPADEEPPKEKIGHVAPPPPRDELEKAVGDSPPKPSPLAEKTDGETAPPVNRFRRWLGAKAD